jgi:hypothetical protein
MGNILKLLLSRVEQYAYKNNLGPAYLACKVALFKIQRLLYSKYLGPFLARNITFGIDRKDSGFLFYAKRNRRVIGHLYLSLSEGDDKHKSWWIQSLTIGYLYRNLSVGKRLAASALEFIKQGGPQVVCVRIRKCPILEIFWKDLGFSGEPDGIMSHGHIQYLIMSKSAFTDEACPQ